jgi:hypothetical protein
MAVATRIADTSRGPFVGKYTGTTAAQNIHIGFKPAYIRAWNRTDGDTEYVWCKDDLANVEVITTAAATAAIAITQVDNGTVLGFGLPSDAVVNENTKVYVFIAFPE